jgi:hypothetical protein
MTIKAYLSQIHSFNKILKFGVTPTLREIQGTLGSELKMNFIPHHSQERYFLILSTDS